MPLRGTRILVVEDDTDCAELTKILLGARGARVTVANNGEDALRLIATDCPDVIISDLMMPGLDGFGLAQAIRRMPECAHVRLIALSALPAESCALRTRGAGFDAHIEKPLTFEKLEDIASGRLFVPSPRYNNGTLSEPRSTSSPSS